MSADKPITAPAADAIEQSIRQCYSTWSETYDRDYYQAATAYPPVHVDIVRRKLQSSGARSLIDAGCGPASMLRRLTDLGLDLYGFDLTPAMVSQARQTMAGEFDVEQRLWEGSALDRTAFVAPDGRARFDAAVCFGVLPHIPAGSDRVVFENLAKAVQPHGLVMVEARNQLFSLFSLNRYSRDFFFRTLLDTEALRQSLDEDSARQLAKAIDLVEQRFRLDLPPERTGAAGAPGYDEVLSRTHNPFELCAVARQAGLLDVEVSFYHYHCLPPMAEPAMPALYRELSLAMERPDDWRGHFMASAFIVSGRAR